MFIPQYYEFYCPVKVVSGLKAVSNLPAEMEQFGAKRALVVTDQGVVGAGLISIIKAAFEGSACEIAHIFDTTPPDSSMKVVNDVAELYRKHNCDCFVAVGGGSSIDTAKGAIIVIAENTSDIKQFQGAERLKKPTPPFFAVPTTSGTGSEVTLVAVISNPDLGAKMAFNSYNLMPNVAFIDPQMTATMPPRITAATGMDALTHAVEAYYCLQKNPISDSLAITAINIIMANLETCVTKGDDLDARLAMGNAALIAGMSFCNSMVGVAHALAHATGGVCHVPHGVANNIYLPWAMENNLPLCTSTIAELAPWLCRGPVSGSDEARAKAAIQAVRDISLRLNKQCGLAYRLRDANVTEDKLPAIARGATNDGASVYNPVDVTYDAALDILKKAF